MRASSNGNSNHSTQRPELKAEQKIETRDTDANARESEKEYFKILNKQNVFYDETENVYKLRYYPMDTAAEVAEVPLQKIKTEHSADDDYLKYPFARFCYYILFAGLFVLFTANPFHWFLHFFGMGEACPNRARLLGVSCAHVAGPVAWTVVAGVVLLLRFAYLAKDIEKNFVGINAHWENAIDKFFAPDVGSKMEGVRLCMLKFRQFIKWRRFANFYLNFFWASAVPLTLGAVILAFYCGSLGIFEVVCLSVFFGGLLLVIRWFRIQRYKHTEWRDPTVQLCVMIAELHQRLIERTTMVGEAHPVKRQVDGALGNYPATAQ